MTETQFDLQEAQRLLREGAPQQAEHLLKAQLETAPADLEARYALAVAQRHQSRWQEALDTLSAVFQTKPDFGRAHQEAGYNHIALKDFSRARRAFERATAADSSLGNSWQCLAKLCHDQGQPTQAARARRQAAHLETLPAEIRTVIGYLAEDRLADAERLCKRFLRTHKTHAEGMRLLAEIAARNRVYDQAEFLLESCIEFHPEHRDARIQYLNLLLRVQKFAQALEQADLLMTEYPQNAELFRALYAAACAGVGKNQAAITNYRLLMRQQPKNPAHPVALAHLHKAAGELDQAVALYRRAYRIKADYGDAFWSLANTKSYSFTDAEMKQMAAAEQASGAAEEDHIQLCFALGKAWEDRREWERSFRYYARGNALKQAKTEHSPERLEARVSSQIEVCTEDLFARRQGVGLAAPDPIFIVGLPRAGSTLLEQILASHSQVDGTMELHNILSLARRLRGRDEGSDGAPGYPRILAELEDDYFRRFGQQFIDNTRAYRGAAPFFIDKMPNNFFHLGLIKLILPKAKVIDARRHPMACCFSGFKQLFGEGQEFSYGLREIGNYYRQYARLMAHWERALPGFVLRVQYEDVVHDLEAQVRRLLEFCGLPFEPACLNYHQTDRSIRTPSAQQVRQPIYTAGLEQWRHFEPWLGPLKEGLGDLHPAPGSQ